MGYDAMGRECIVMKIATPPTGASLAGRAAEAES